MSAVTTTPSTTPTNAYGDAVSTAGVSTLTSSQFMHLLVTQLQNQDPTDPESDEDMASQMAQFSQLSELSDMNTSLTGLTSTSQLSSGAGLIGATVISSQQDSSGNDVSGTVQSVTSSNGTISVDVGGTSVPLSSITAVAPNSSNSATGS
jgi:flagellar basal-body rod modification protein FlgD